MPQDAGDMLIPDPEIPCAFTFSNNSNNLDAPTVFYEDNQAAITLANAPITRLHEKSRALTIRDYFCRNCVSAGEARVIYVPSKLNLADMMTKPLNRDVFKSLRDQVMGYAPIQFFE